LPRSIWIDGYVPAVCDPCKTYWSAGNRSIIQDYQLDVQRDRVKIMELLADYEKVTGEHYNKPIMKADWQNAKYR